METSASYEARSAPLPYPTNFDDRASRSPLVMKTRGIVLQHNQPVSVFGTTGLKQRMENSYEKGLAICSAPSLALGIVRYTAKRRQGYRWGGQLSS
jgi:hypothetical protein